MIYRIRKVVLNALPFCCVLLTSCVPLDMRTWEDTTKSPVMEEQIVGEDSKPDSSGVETGTPEMMEASTSTVDTSFPEPGQLSPPATPSDPSHASSLIEHKGTKTSWEALRAKVTGEINEHQRQIQQLNLKLQLIDQIANKLELTTKAHFRKGHLIVVDFVIENPTTYALKDISISCDQIAPTGTKISTHTETLYAIVETNATQSFEGVELDQLHKQTQSLNCEIKNFTVHNQ